MPNLERRVERLERRSMHRTGGKELFGEDLLDIFTEYDDIDVIDQGVTFGHEGPLGGRSVQIPLLYEDEFERTHQIMVMVYADSRIDATFAEHGWIVDECGD